jgi:hypothetical protein
MKKIAILLFAVVALTACSSGESKCEGEGCDSTAVVAVDTTAVAPVAVDTNTVAATDSTSVK